MRHLRNRKDFPCFYRVIETRVEVWEKREIAWDIIKKTNLLILIIKYCLYFIFLNSRATRNPRESSRVSIVVIETRVF